MSQTRPSEEANGDDFPAWYKEVSQYAKDSGLVIERLEQLQDSPEMAESLRGCREIRRRLIEVLGQDEVLSREKTWTPPLDIKRPHNAEEKQEILAWKREVVEELTNEWLAYFSREHLKGVNVNLIDVIAIMTAVKVCDTMAQQKKVLREHMRVRFHEIIFNSLFGTATEYLETLFPEDFYEIFRQETIDKTKEKVALLPELKEIFERFCQLRAQVKALSSEVRPLISHRAELNIKLAIQRQDGLKKSQRKRISIWANKLTSAEERVIADQVPLSDYEMKGMDFNWVIDPAKLEGEERRLHMLDVVQASTLHAARKIFITLQGQLDENEDDEDFDDEADTMNPELN